MVIVGAGRAGARAVIGLREHGWQGAITLIGEETLAPYDRPPLSKASLTDAAEPAPVYLLDEDTIKSLDAIWLGGSHATAVDRASKAVILADGRRVPYHRLLIATGAKARTLTLPGAARCLTLRDFDESTALREVFTPGRSVAVIGGGFIGLELAASAAKRGARVTVIEALPRIMMRGVPEEIASVVAARHAAEGVSILTGAAIAGIDGDTVVLKDGRRIAADIVIAGIGAAPATALGAAAGLAMDNGIACDTMLRTSDPDIFAAGDCCSFPHPLFGDRRLRLETWRSAQDQAAVAAENMAGSNRSYEAVPWFWSDQFDLSLQIAGDPAMGTAMVRRPLKDGAFILCHLDVDGVLVGASGIGPGNSIARDIKLAEMLIAKKASPAPATLADPAVQLRSLLKG